MRLLTFGASLAAIAFGAIALPVRRDFDRAKGVGFGARLAGHCVQLQGRCVRSD